MIPTAVFCFLLGAVVHAQHKISFLNNGELQFSEVASERHFESTGDPTCYLTQVEFIPPNIGTQNLIEYLCCDLSALCCVATDEETQPRSILRSRPRPKPVADELTQEQLSDLRLRTKLGNRISAESTDVIPDEGLNLVCERYLELCREHISILPCVGRILSKAIVILEKYEDTNSGSIEI